MSALLPSETLSAIFENLQPSELTKVTRTSHRFQGVAERILYSNIGISECISRSSPKPSRTLRCCKTLLQNPHLPEVVRTLNIRWHTEPGPREHYLQSIEPVLAKLNCALRTMIRIEMLDLAFGLIGVHIPSQSILSGCRFPSLRFFALSGIGRGSLPAKCHPATIQLEWFLHATPSIERLRLTDYYEPINLLPSDLPLVWGFRGSAITAASVLPGRPVRCLALVGEDPITEWELALIAQTTARIQWLDLSAFPVTPNTLRDVSQHLKDVRYLRVRLALHHALHHSFTGIVSLTFDASCTRLIFTSEHFGRADALTMCIL